MGKGAVCGRTEQLLKEPWDEDVDPFSNTIKLTITRLSGTLAFFQLVAGMLGLLKAVFVDR